MRQSASSSPNVPRTGLQEDADELNEILNKKEGGAVCPRDVSSSKEFASPSLSHYPPVPEARKENTFCQWSSSNGKAYYPTTQTCDAIPPGAYEPSYDQQRGFYLSRFEVKVEGLIRFPETNSEAIIGEICNFWNKESLYRRYDLIYKRGILMYGPPGGGKSSTIGLLMRDVIERGGIVMKFNSPEMFSPCFRMLREIEPEKPIVVLMEDLDATLEHHSETAVLNILDGVERCHKVVFLATTNYPERLGKRIVNRPSRFDKRYKIGHPNPESRRLYLEHLADAPDNSLTSAVGHDGDFVFDEATLTRWVGDTKDFSLAHLKELFTAVVILGDDYDEAIATLSSMKGAVSSEKDVDGNFGLRR